MKITKILTILILTVVIFAGFTLDGYCKAKARARALYCHVHVKAICKGTSGSDGENINKVGSCPMTYTAEAYCTSSYAYAWGHAWKVGRKKYASARAYSWSWLGYGSTGKRADEFDTSHVMVDTSTISIDSVDGTKGVNLSLIGQMSAMSNTSSRLFVDVFQEDDTNQVVFSGTVLLNGSSKEWQVTGFNPENFIETIDGDTIKLSYDFIHEDIIYYSGSLDSVGITITADPTVLNPPVPSLTTYGILFLLAIIISTGTWIYIRKRRSIVL